MIEAAWLVRLVGSRYLVVGIDRGQLEIVRRRDDYHVYLNRKQAHAVAKKLNAGTSALRDEDVRCTEVMKRV